MRTHLQLHLRGCRRATITVRASDGGLMWQTPLARELLGRYCGTQAPTTPEPVLAWLRNCLPQVVSAGQGGGPPRLAIARGAMRLTFRLHQQIGDTDGNPKMVTG